MSMGTNLQFLRRQKGITQEQLAEQMEVSRQTVSKWEADAAYPEMAKLLALSALFGCTLDTLVQGDAEKESAADTQGYDRQQNRFAAIVTAGIAVIVLGLTLSAFLSCRWPGEQANDLAGIGFLLCLTLGVIPLIVAGMQNEAFRKRNPCVQPFYTQRQIDAFENRYPAYIGTGVGCLLVGLVLAALFSLALPGWDWAAGPVFMLLANVGLPLLVWAGMQKSKYDIGAYNGENAPSEAQQEKYRIIGAISGVVMLLATALFLLLGLGKGLWQSAAVIYPVAGVLCGVAAVAVNGFKK